MSVATTSFAPRERRVSNASFAPSLRSLRSVQSISTASILSTISVYGHLTPLSGLGARVPVRGSASVNVLNVRAGAHDKRAAQQPQQHHSAAQHEQQEHAPPHAHADASLARAVHECYVAGRYRQLAQQEGGSLGLSLAAGGSGSGRAGAGPGAGLSGSGSDDEDALPALDEDGESITTDDATTAMAMRLDSRQNSTAPSSSLPTPAADTTGIAGFVRPGDLSSESASASAASAGKQTQSAARLQALLTKDTLTRSAAAAALKHGVGGGAGAGADEGAVGQDRQPTSIVVRKKTGAGSRSASGHVPLQSVFPPNAVADAPAGDDAQGGGTLKASDGDGAGAGASTLKAATLGKSSSKRAYAASRVKAATLFDKSLESAAPADVTKLEWEIRALSPITPAHMLLPLLKRAAELDSLRSTVQLCALYAFGVARGGAGAGSESAPGGARIELVRRDALRAFGWAVKGLTVALDAKRRGAPPASGGASSQERAGAAAAQHDETEPTLALIHLLARVSRARRAAWPAVPRLLPDAASSDERQKAARIGRIWKRMDELLPSAEAFLLAHTAAAAPDALAADDGPEADAGDQSLDLADTASQASHSQAQLVEGVEAARSELAFLRALSGLRTAAETHKAPADLRTADLEVLESCEQQGLAGKAAALLEAVASQDERQVATCVAVLCDALSATLPEEHTSPPSPRTKMGLGMPRNRSSSTAVSPAQTAVFPTLRSKSAGSAAVTASHANASAASNEASALIALQQVAFTPSKEVPFDPFFIEHSRSKPAEYLNPPSPTASIRSISSAWGYGEEDTELARTDSARFFPRPRRPSSVISDSPSLVFPSEQPSAEQAPPAASERPVLRQRSSLGLGPRRRVISMHGEPSVAVSPSLHSPASRSPSNPVATGGKTFGRLAFLMSPALAAPHTSESTAAAGTLGRAHSHASQSLRQLGGAGPAPAPLNPATRLMRKSASRPRPLSVLHSASEPALSTEQMAKPPQQDPPSPARSTASGRAFAGLDPTDSRSHSRANSANSSVIDLTGLTRSGTSHPEGLDSVLAAAEERSKFNTGGSCSTCAQPVVNGAMNRKGQIFCSRACRLATKAKAQT